MKKTLAFAIFASLSLLASQGMAAEGKAPAEDKPAAEHEHKSCCPVMKDKMKKNARRARYEGDGSQQDARRP